MYPVGYVPGSRPACPCSAPGSRPACPPSLPLPLSFECFVTILCLVSREMKREGNFHRIEFIQKCISCIYISIHFILLSIFSFFVDFRGRSRGSSPSAVFVPPCLERNLSMIRRHKKSPLTSRYCKYMKLYELYIFYDLD